MEKINFSMYFSDDEKMYYGSKYLIIILENIIGDSFENIKDEINNSSINLIEEEIVGFLDSNYSKDNLELKEQSIKIFTNIIKYTNNLKNKILLLLDVVEKISDKDTESIKELISDFDIDLDCNGNIKKEDIIRLVTFLITSINIFNREINIGNNLENFLDPNLSFQIKDLNFDDLDFYIPLSENQRNKLLKLELKYIRNNTDVVFNLW